MSGIPSKNINYLLQYLALPLIQTQPGVCGGQQRLQGGVQLIQLNGELGKTVVALVVHWHCICMTQTDRKEDPPPSISTPYMGFIDMFFKKQLVVLALQTHVADGGSPQ